MQLSVDVQIPSCFGGNDGHAVYIDTEGSFVVERLVDIARAAITHCHFIASVQRNEGEAYSCVCSSLVNLFSHDYLPIEKQVMLLDLMHRCRRYTGWAKKSKPY